MPTVAYDAWLALVAAQRLWELALSRRNARTLSRRARAATGDADWYAMIALHVALIVLPFLEVHLLDRRAPAWLAVTCFAAFAGAQMLRLACVWALGKSWNARALVDPAQEACDRGPYRRVRHPNYVAVIVEMLCIPLGGGAWWSALVLGAASVPILVRRIRGEERLLVTMPGYAERMGAKPRFVPRWRELFD